jgi:hypothetical protein
VVYWNGVLVGFFYKNILLPAFAFLFLSQSAFGQASAGKRGKGGFTIHFGEAYQPANYRFTNSAYELDIGITRVPSLMYYVGSRNWAGNAYVGYGVGVLDTLGFYGSVGYEFCAIICIGGEFIGGGNTDGYSNGYATISTGFIW